MLCYGYTSIMSNKRYKHIGVYWRSCLRQVLCRLMVLTKGIPHFIYSKCIGGAFGIKERLKLTYHQQIQDPRWKLTTLRIMQRDKFMCQECNRLAERPHVHHIKYIPWLRAWEHPPETLKTLCDECHKEYHDKNGYTYVAPEVCSKCGNMVINSDGYGQDDKRTFYCESCVEDMEFARGELI